jgi:hypothetical protein
MSTAWVVWIALGAILAAGALFISFSFGVVFGYAWRDRISRRRRLQAEQEQKLEELAHALGRALSEEAVIAYSNASDGAIAEAIGVSERTVNRARKAVATTEAVEKAGAATRRVKLTVVQGGVHQEPSDGKEVRGA